MRRSEDVEKVEIWKNERREKIGEKRGRRRKWRVNRGREESGEVRI